MEAHPDTIALIVAAGSGERAGGGVPKQYRDHRGKPLLRHGVERLAAHPAIAGIWIVIRADQQEMARQALAGIDGCHFVTGGASRRESVRNGLEAIAERGAPDRILIHDAARPDVPGAVVQRLIEALEHSPGAIPVLPVADTLIVEADGDVVDREKLRRVQTPQAFRFDAILAAHRAWPTGRSATDDAQIMRANGGNIALVGGDERLRKLTYAPDFGATGGDGTALRIGSGYDVHRLLAGEELWLCGVKIDHPLGLTGHSDADVALHALTDAVLGAIGTGDIGSHFPPSDPQWKGAASHRFLTHAIGLAEERGYELANADLTIVCEAPKIAPHRQRMIERLAAIIGCPSERISVKATTTEGLGFTGRGEAIAAQATILLSRKAS